MKLKTDAGADSYHARILRAVADRLMTVEAIEIAGFL